MTRQRAALVEAATPGESLEEQVQNLSQSVSAFKLDSAAGAHLVIANK